jgi:hypothetical protein
MKKSKSGMWGALFAVLAGALFSLPTEAQTFRLYAGIVPTSYKISFDQNAPNFGGSLNYQNRTAKSNYLAANVGGTWISSAGIYVDLSLLQSLSATHDLWTDVSSEKQDFSHDSYTLTAGYARAFGPGVTVSGFGGLIRGSTALNAPNPPFTFGRDKFDSQGLFVGVGGGVPALRGQFSGSVAIAFMNGKWRDDSGYNNSATTTVGFSLGGAYTYKLTQAWGVTADLRHQQYSYNFDAQPPVAVNEYTVKEQITSLGVRLSYQF